MKSRFLMELTTPEVERYLSGSGTTAFLPVGSVEMHGPHQPVGTDTIIAKAFCLRIAEAADGLVLPEFHYSWAGSTDGFAGTISMGMDLEQAIVETIAIRSLRMGFKRFVMVSVHAPNNHILYLSARRIYEQHHRPALFVDPYKPIDDAAAGIFAGDYEQSKEASLVLASLEALGQPDLYSEEAMRYDEEAPAFPASFQKLGQIGGVGYFMQDPRQHACPSRFVSKEKGLQFIARQSAAIAAVLPDLDSYGAEAARQANQGWSAHEESVTRS
jgi:creatinine amidohydrolase